MPGQQWFRLGLAVILVLVADIEQQTEKRQEPNHGYAHVLLEARVGTQPNFLDGLEVKGDQEQ